MLRGWPSPGALALHEDVEGLLAEDRPAAGSSSRSRKVTTIGAAVLGVGALVGVAAVRAGHAAGRGLPRLAPARVVALDAAAACHTAQQGEPCYEDVKWAMNIGLQGHPEWYAEPCPHLRMGASFEEFQVCVVKINRSSCILPCNPAGGLSKEQVDKIRLDEKPKASNLTAPCHLSRPGESCFTKVVHAMKKMKDSDRKKTTFEEVQAKLHMQDESCPRPCSCKTAVHGEKCYDRVIEAKKHTVKKHPGQFPGLTPHSTFEAFQTALHKDGVADCGSPCNSQDFDELLHLATTNTKKEETRKEEEEGEHEEVQSDKAAKKAEKRMREEAKDTADDKAVTTPAPKEETCKTATEAMKCYQDVLYGMQHGIHEHPEWYPGLTAKSGFEEFQSILAKNPDLDCPEPCPCHTAKPGEECYARVQWVLGTGLAQHPDWYPGLNAGSRFETVQTRVREDPNSTCDKPCMQPLWGSPSLFCFSVFRSQGYELELVKAQVGSRVGIFSCDDFAVLSDQVLPVTGGINTLQIPPCESTGVSKDGTAANTLIFMKAWNVIKNDGRYANHDWTIKADPDAVVIVPRLRNKLLPHTGKEVYMKNCMKWTGPGWPMMFGSLEAFSREAMQAYYAGAERCTTDLQWQAWGEDFFMGACLDMLGVFGEFDSTIIGDNVCKGANCADGQASAYHPFKSAASWFECYQKATR